MPSKHTATCPYCESAVGELPSHLPRCEAKSPDPQTGEPAPVAEASGWQHAVTADSLEAHLRDRLTLDERLLTKTPRLADRLDASSNGVAQALRTLRERPSSLAIERQASATYGGAGTWVIERRERAADGGRDTAVEYRSDEDSRFVSTAECREMRALRADGLAMPEIARDMDWSKHTVAEHVAGRCPHPEVDDGDG
jgi:hypothetical protein